MVRVGGGEMSVRVGMRVEERMREGECRSSSKKPSEGSR